MSFSLPSIVVAIALLGYVATALRPAVESSDLSRLTAAAEQLAATIRIVQSTSIGAGESHGLIFDPASMTFNAVRADLTSEPFTAAALLHHPVTHKPLLWQADTLISVNPQDTPFRYTNAAAANHILFNRWGSPVLPVGGQNQQLENSAITLTSSNHRVVLTIGALNGRVVIE